VDFLLILILKDCSR